jgi:hypothetical protein
MSANDQTIESHKGGGGSSHDDKPQSTATLAKTFRTLRKRLSRTSNSNKHEDAIKQVRSKHKDKDNAIKSGGDDSEASSTGEEFTQLSFTEVPTSNPDLTAIASATSTATSLKVHRSLPAEKTPAIVTSSPPFESNEPNAKTDDSGSSNENSNLSKTWSPSAFTGAQLHGTCSLEYIEYTKDKSHKRKAHMIDLRKDDVQHHQQLTATMSATSKHSISTSFTSYHRHSLTVFSNKGALSYSSINLHLFTFN